MRRPNRLWMIVLLGSLSAFGPLSVDMYLPALPILANDLHASASVAQLSLTAFLIGLAAGQVVAGPLSDANGRRKPLMAGLVIFTAASVLCVIMPSIWGLIAMRFVQGTAAAAGIVISRAVIRDLYSGSELTKFFALTMLVNGVAPIAAPVIGGQLLSFVSWPGVFGVLAIVGAITLFAVFAGMPETLAAERQSAGGIKQTLSTFKLLMTDKVFMGYCLVQGFVMAAMFAYIAGSPFVLQDFFGLSPQAFSLCFAVNGLGIVVATQITGQLAGKIGESALLKAGLVMALGGSALMLLMLAIEAHLIAVLIPLVFAVSSVGVVSTTCFSLAMNNKEQTAGSASAFLGLMPYIFGALAAPLAGIGAGSTTLPMGIIMVGCHLAAVFSYMLLCRKAH
ncbi:multidrug effflux MFS transporter [Pseudobacillus badius]|uniref:multidrug effflux MFS transporter n=1 Tax=Bacillus badius TaxID=1455 RepID=UPI0007B0BC56|nr:multidrug effflux MFS transporter [Bacillus badius]KZN98571.1 Bcr/CflA family drug resistance efflux transporter [Bacillus badius]MED0666147.1 multidrug effflux MFS transporter [Bacillus badius]OCS83271.1 Bcr/CflA family drug resistance efflux transporter [Bacillus badius]OVE51672.1 MFS transporter [Bacillus badius]UAT32478.1 multidrug effflux MFS transporter [Bacillus badius]